MLDRIEKIRKDILEESGNINSKDSLEQFRLKFLSRKGLLNDLFEEFKAFLTI